MSKQRYNRIAQAKKRGSTSYKTELENALIMLAWEADILSEGQCASMLQLDRVTLRKWRLTALDRATALAEQMDAPRQARLMKERDARAALNSAAGGTP
jgi:hypothetical protein